MSRVRALLVAPVLAGCLGFPSSEVYVATYDVGWSRPTALIQGILEVDAGCLWVDSGPERSLLALPIGAYVEERGDGYVLRGTGGPDLPMGVSVTIGGGQYGQEHYDFVVDRIGEEIPAPCQQSGLYWLGYEPRQTDD